MPIFVRTLFLLLVILMSTLALAADEGILLCGVAKGYPPYQFQQDNGFPVGLDIEVARLLSERMGRQVVFHQDKWDKVVTSLRLSKLDCIAGIEINETRRIMFDFTEPYYSRKGMVFVLAENDEVNSLKDLQWQVIAGDRHSHVERRFEALGLKNRIRIHQSPSKDISMLMLKQGQVVAVVAPQEVGFFLADKHGIRVKIIDDTDPGSPVGFAVEKGHDNILKALNDALIELKNEGVLEAVLKKWQRPTIQ